MATSLITWPINKTFIVYVKDDELDLLFMCAKFWFPSILCAKVIASDSPSHFPKAIKPVRPRPLLTWEGQERGENKSGCCTLSFSFVYFGVNFWLTFSKLQLDLQSKSNFAHKVDYEQSLFFLGPSSKTPETHKRPRFSRLASPLNALVRVHSPY